MSLTDLVGRQYTQAVCQARAALDGETSEAQALAERRVDFFPQTTQTRLLAMLGRVGQAVAPALPASATGATTARFAAASAVAPAPLAGSGYYRIGEDGRLYLLTKAEHYHAPLGHAFGGFELLEIARRLGIPQATHNNTRGHITRLLEQQLIAAANGIAADDEQGVARFLRQPPPEALSRVINLETGSLAAEAALKIVLNRFYAIQSDSPAPKYEGRIPVIVVLGDELGLQANYHGTTILAQTLRGMWAPLLAGMERQNLLMVRAVPFNNIERLEQAFAQFEQPPYKIAGFFHEIVLMNFGARLLTEAFMRRAYALCEKHDVPCVVDEIQSGVWSPELYMFREYGLRPKVVCIGKGFPGGEFPASRVLLSADLDTLPQFGALVTNGQEELAAIAYLVTMAWARANAEVTRAVGDYFEHRLRDLTKRHRQIVDCDGKRHLAALHFADVTQAKAFTTALNRMGLDISVQTYKTSVPPAALLKLPLICGYEVVDAVIARMEAALSELNAGGGTVLP